jgi:gas vesicle protein
MNRYQVVSFAAGLLSGAVVGGLVGTLLAPQSGNDARKAITDKVNEIIEAGKQARLDRRKELEAQYREAIQIPLSTEQDTAQALS